MTPQDIYENFNTLLSIPIPLEKNERTFWHAPLEIEIGWHEYNNLSQEPTPEVQATIKSLIMQLDSHDEWIRSRVMLYLMNCWNVNILSSANKKQIARLLIKYAAADELPSEKCFCKFAYIRFLSPLKAHYNVPQRLMDYYRSYTFQFYTKNKDSISFGHDSNIVRFFQSLLQTCSCFRKKTSLYLNFTEDDAWTIFSNLNTSWKNSKEVLNKNIKEQNGWSDDVQALIAQMLFYCDMAMGEVFISRTSNKEHLKAMESFVAEVEALTYCPISRIGFATKTKQYTDNWIFDIFRSIGQDDQNNFNSSSIALKNAYGFAKLKLLPSPPSILLHALINAIGMKSNATFKIACFTMGNILDYYVIPAVEENLLLGYIESLNIDTDFSSNSKRFPIADRSDYRIAVVYLVASLYKRYIKSNKEVPAVITNWHDICHSNNEFPTIRNTWKSRIGYSD